LADLRAAVANQVGDAEGIAAARTVLLKVFEEFTLHSGTVADLEPEDGPGPADDNPFIDAVAAGKYVILTKPRRAAIIGLDENERPVLRREPLPLPANSDGEGFPTPSELYAGLFGPIRLGEAS
jgi:hypothetical protein